MGQRSGAPRFALQRHERIRMRSHFRIEDFHGDERVAVHGFFAAQVARLSRVTHQEDQAADRFRDAIHLWLRQGEIRSACDAYEEMKRLLGGVTLPPGDLLRVARGCEELGRPGDASRAYEAYGRNYPDRGGAALALMKSAEIEHRALNNPGRARYLYDELLRRQLKPDLEKLVHEWAQRADAALARQGTAAAAGGA
jgi:hypothetical protein